MSGILRKFTDKFRLGRAEERKTLQKYGIDVVRNQVLSERVSAQYRIMELIRTGSHIDPKTGERTIITCDGRVQLIDQLIRVAAVPWGRAGDRGKFAKMMMHWELLVKTWEDVTNMRNSYHDEEAHLQPEIDRLIDNFGKREIIPFGLMIVDASYLSEDIAPQYIALIQSVAQQGFGGTSQLYPTGDFADQSGKKAPAPDDEPIEPITDHHS